jgi:hypothetical protein
MRRIRTFTTVVLLACSTAAWAAQNGNADVMSGGIGSDARDQLAQQARDHNLKLVFALSSREYVSDVEVNVADSRGKSVATATSEGPWMFVKLPPGAYTVKATFNGKSQTKKVAVGKSGQKTVNFLWPTSAGVTGETAGSKQ